MKTTGLVLRAPVGKDPIAQSKHLYRVWTGIVLGIPNAGRPGEFGIVTGATPAEAAAVWFQRPVRRLGPWRYAAGQMLALLEPLGCDKARGGEPGRPRSVSDGLVAAMLRPGMGLGEWAEACAAAYGVSRSTFKRVVRRLHAEGQIARCREERVTWVPVEKICAA